MSSSLAKVDDSLCYLSPLASEDDTCMYLPYLLYVWQKLYNKYIKVNKDTPSTPKTKQTPPQQQQQQNKITNKNKTTTKKTQD